MDEHFRKQKVERFFLQIGISYGKGASLFFENLGVNVIEELKLLKEEDWDNVCNNIMVSMKVIQKRRLGMARQQLMATGEIDLSIGAPLPIQDNSSCNEEKNNATVGRKK